MNIMLINKFFLLVCWLKCISYYPSSRRHTGPVYFNKQSTAIEMRISMSPVRN